jgi:4-alpha-glucanotransferase
VTDALHSLAKALGVHTRYIDGLGRRVVVGAETLVRVCAALGAPVARPRDAAAALGALRAEKKKATPPVAVAWDGRLGRGKKPLPLGYHRIEDRTVISAPRLAWRRPGAHRSWGVGAQLAALRSSRSRSLGDLRDLESLSQWIGERGGDLVALLPLLPTFNSRPAEPSPYSSVSRLFWSELMLDLEAAPRKGSPTTLDVTRADAEVRAALAGLPVPNANLLDDELVRYARFRGAQKRLGRNWRAWPAAARAGALAWDDIDADEERFHLVAQTLARSQLSELRARLERRGVRLGLDLAVGVHPDGYDPWSRQSLFAEGMSVGAPPDQGFPSGQDWGFSPVLPEASRREGHQYLAASIAHQMAPAGLLRVDHIMAWTRLYWIPHGMGLHQGTYVSYPAEELFAILTLESHRHRCEVVGENLGTVPREIDTALPRHKIWGMYLAQFEAACGPRISPPAGRSVALVGTHDTPTFAGWIAGNDIGERLRYQLLVRKQEPRVRKERAQAVRWLAQRLRCSIQEPRGFLGKLLDWLGRSRSPLVVPWLEDLWLEEGAVNLPGTRSSERPNWQRPMGRLLETIFTDAEVDGLVRRLDRARKSAPIP